MKKIPNLIYSFRSKVTIAILVPMFFFVVLSSLLIYRVALRQQFTYLSEQLKAVVRNAALMIDGDTVMQIPLEPQAVHSASYKGAEVTLALIRKSNPFIKYIYIMAETKEPGMLQFIVDLEDPSLAAKGKRSFAYPGEIYDASRMPDLLNGFKHVSADREITVDSWGATLSGYAPIFDKKGRIAAMLGIDVSADYVNRLQATLYYRLIVLTLLSICISLLAGLWFSRHVTEPVKKLVAGTRAISKGDLNFKVDVRGRGEIKELADSFNDMAASLLESREKLRDYFYRSVKSLVRGLEAKDRYTAGHSERVSEYAYKVAVEMGLPEEKAGLLRDAAELHDIGKLGIPENILNKNGKLDDNEWALMRMHPVVGMDILKPIAPNDDFLSVVRSHHERCDGTGYPDKLKDGQINILAKIACVCDAYDAMTSNRSYRPAFTKEHAISELQDKSGTQFDPEVVKAFVRAIHKG